VESAIWGNFRGVYRSTTVNGVSHADIIDLKRIDYKGFNVHEAYINIVQELKVKGY
jgi:triacylglycerol lipase